MYILWNSRNANFLCKLDLALLEQKTVCDLSLLITWCLEFDSHLHLHCLVSFRVCICIAIQTGIPHWLWVFASLHQSPVVMIKVKFNDIVDVCTMKYTYSEQGKHGLCNIERMPPVMISDRTVVLFHSEHPSIQHLEGRIPSCKLHWPHVTGSCYTFESILNLSTSPLSTNIRMEASTVWSSLSGRSSNLNEVREYCSASGTGISCRKCKLVIYGRYWIETYHQSVSILQRWRGMIR